MVGEFLCFGLHELNAVLGYLILFLAIWVYHYSCLEDWGMVAAGSVLLVGAVIARRGILNCLREDMARLRNHIVELKHAETRREVLAQKKDA